MYRGASSLLESNTMPGDAALSTWNRILKMDNMTQEKTISPVILAQLMSNMGDGVLTRIRYHTVGGGLHQPEQLDRNTGK